MTRPTIRKGDEGSLVRDVQRCLMSPLDIDGDFGEATETAVQEYQESQRLEVDGVVGPQTWEHLEQDYRLPPYPPPLLPPLDEETLNQITELAMQSPVAEYNWQDRGESPPGYTQGMALAYATVVRKWHARDSAALDMAQADTGNKETDALALYADVFAEFGWDNDEDGLDTLRHLFVLIWGLGMRESSGRHCEGRDMSAENVSSDTAEAGLFQTSWNASYCSAEFERLLDQYQPNIGSQQCALDVFKQGVSCSSTDWQCYGSGTGYDFQETCKQCPQFAVETCAIGLRHLCQHWGPIIRQEAEINSDVDDLLIEIEAIIAEYSERPERPEPPDVEQPPVEEIPPQAEMRDIVISSGHGLKIRGACGPEPWGVDEVDEVRKIVETVAQKLRDVGGHVVTLHDDSSTTQSANLDWIVDHHNECERSLDVSVHLNCYDQSAHGVEVLYVTQEDLARKVSAAIAKAGGFTDRGPKYRGDLAFLNGTDEASILLECFFCDNKSDIDKYHAKYDAICQAIADTIGPAD